MQNLIIYFEKKFENISVPPKNKLPEYSKKGWMYENGF